MTSGRENVASTKRGVWDFNVLSRQILRHANLGLPRIEFLRRVSTLLLELSDCDALELDIFGDIRYRWRATSRPEESFSFQLVNGDVVGGDLLAKWRVRPYT